MGIGASFWWWDALPHQPAGIREETLESGNLFSGSWFSASANLFHDHIYSPTKLVPISTYVVMRLGHWYPRRANVVIWNIFRLTCMLPFRSDRPDLMRSPSLASMINSWPPTGYVYLFAYGSDISVERYLGKFILWMVSCELIIYFHGLDGRALI